MSNLEFKDIVPPIAGERLDVIVKDREGKEIGMILNVGTPNEVRFDKQPLVSRPLAESVRSEK